MLRADYAVAAFRRIVSAPKTSIRGYQRYFHGVEPVARRAYCDFSKIKSVFAVFAQSLMKAQWATFFGVPKMPQHPLAYITPCLTHIDLIGFCVGCYVKTPNFHVTHL